MEYEAWLLLLHRTIAALNEGAPPAVLSSQVLEGISQLLQADMALLCTFEEGGSQALLWRPEHGAMAPLGIWPTCALLDFIRQGGGIWNGPLSSDCPDMLRPCTSIAAVPLNVERRVVGALLLGRPGRNFQKEDVALLEPVAGILGIALARLGPMQARGPAIFATEPAEVPPARRLLSQILGQLVARTAATAGLVLLVQKKKAPELACQVGLTAEQEARLRKSLRVRHGRDLARPDIFAPERAPFALWAELNAHSTLVAPLWLRGRFLGAIFLALPASPDKTIVSELETAAATAALTLQLEAECLHVQRRLRESEALLQVVQALARPASFEELLNTIIQTAVENIPAAEAGVVHLLTDGETLEPMGTFRTFLPLSKRIRMRLGVGLAGEALQEGQTLRVDDVTRDPRFLAGDGPPPYRSLLVAPMAVGGRKVGTLSLQSSRVAAYTPDDARFLTILAGHAAMVVENERLLVELRQRLEELTRAQAYLVRAEKLAATGRLAANVAHEINNPLEGIKNFLALLSRRIPADDPNQEFARLVGVGFERIRNTVRQLLSFSRQEEAGRHPCDLHEVVENALAMVRSRLLAEHIGLQVDLPGDLPWVMASPLLLEQAFLNLFLSAADALADGGSHLEVRGWYENNRAFVAVRDDGPPIPETFREHLFEPFLPMYRDRTGLSLWACYGIISEHGGTIDVESMAGRGTTFTVSLPALLP